MQSQWQEGYVLTSGPTGTTTTGGASGSSQASGDSSSYSDSSGFAESATSSSGYSSASGAGWWSNVAGQDHYNDQTTWAEPWNLVWMSASGGTTVDHVWGDETNSWGSSGWSSSAGSGSGSGSSTSSSGSLSSSYNQDVGYSGFSTANGGSSGLPAPGADPGWRWGQGWYGAGTNGPLGPTAYSGLGYVFPPGDPVTVTAPNDQSNTEGQAVSLQVQASDASAGSGTGSGGSSASGYSETGLPLGLSINAQTGLISGDIAPGAFMAGPLDVVTVTYTDAAGHSASQSFLWFISDPVTLTNPGDQSGTEGVSVHVTPQASDVNAGALLTWSETGLPAGLSMDPDGGAVTGTPAAGSAGVYLVTLTATDASGASASQTLVWTVAPAVTITDPGLQSGTEGEAVSLPIQATDATGGTLSFSETGLPPGLNISSSGDITGTISAGDAADGLYPATITATDGTYSASQDIVWTVAPAVAVTDPGLQSSKEGDPVALQIQAMDSTGATPTFSATGLPAGLSISSSGQITGTATTAGFYDATITATDGTYSGSTKIGWDVAASAISMTDPGQRSNTEGDAVSLQVEATDADGLPLDYSADNLPAGLSISSTGQITGTISAGAAGFYVATVTASDADDYSASQTFAWSVGPAVTVTDPGRQSSTEGAVVALQMQATDAIGTPTFTATNLPTGLSISSSGKITGTISAGAAAKGPYNVTITATDGSYSASQTLTWAVAPAVTITDPRRQFNLEGDVASLQIQASDATGGTPTFTADNLPAGLQMSSSGKITGTVAAGAAAKGPYAITITATDGVYSASQTLTWAVAAVPAGTWSGDTAALDAFFAALGAQGRAAFDAVVEQTGSKGGSGPVLVGLGHPWPAASRIMGATSPADPSPSAPDFQALFPGPEDEQFLHSIENWWSQLPAAQQQQLLGQLKAVQPRITNPTSPSPAVESAAFQQRQIFMGTYWEYQRTHQPSPPPIPPPQAPPAAPQHGWMSENDYKTWKLILGDALTSDKALINAGAGIAWRTVTLNLLPNNNYRDDLLWPVTDEERQERGYGVQYVTADVIESLALAFVTGKVGGGGGWVGRSVLAANAISNAAAVGKGSYDIYQNGLNWSNGTETAFGVAGLFFDALGVKSAVNEAREAEALAQARPEPPVIPQRPEDLQQFIKPPEFATSAEMRAVEEAERALNKVNCFPPDAVVSTESGLRPIGQVEAGERVWGYDFHSGEWRLCEVECRLEAEYIGPLVTLRVGSHTIEATARHPFWVVEGVGLEERPRLMSLDPGDSRGLSLPGRWVYSHDVREGDVLQLLSGERAVVRFVEERHVRMNVCNLTVSGLHTFAVGKAGVLVHNASDSREAWLKFLEENAGKFATTEEARAAFDAEQRTQRALLRGLTPAGAVKDLEGLEKQTAQALTTEGDKIVGAGDPAVRKVLGIPQDEPAADLLSVTQGGKFDITEVKDSLTGAKVGHALEQLENTVEALQKNVPGAKIGTLAIAVPEGAELPGNFRISGDHLVRDVDGVEEVVKIDGKVVHVMEVPRQ